MNKRYSEELHKHFEDLYLGRTVQSTNQRDKMVYIVSSIFWSARDLNGNGRFLAHCYNSANRESTVNWNPDTLVIVELQHDLFKG